MILVLFFFFFNPISTNRVLIEKSLTYLTLLRKRAEDISRLFSANSSLSTIHKQPHINAIVRDCYVSPVTRQVSGAGMDGRDLMCSIRLEREEEPRVSFALLTDRLDTQQPTPVARGIETLIKEACVGENKQDIGSDMNAILVINNVVTS